MHPQVGPAAERIAYHLKMWAAVNIQQYRITLGRVEIGREYHTRVVFHVVLYDLTEFYLACPVFGQGILSLEKLPYGLAHIAPVLCKGDEFCPPRSIQVGKSAYHIFACRVQESVPSAFIRAHETDFSGFKVGEFHSTVHTSVSCGRVIKNIACKTYHRHGLHAAVGRFSQQCAFGGIAVIMHVAVAFAAPEKFPGARFEKQCRLFGFHPFVAVFGKKSLYERTGRCVEFVEIHVFLVACKFCHIDIFP